MADKDTKREGWTLQLCKSMCKDGKWSLHDGEVYHTQTIQFTTKNMRFIKNRVSQIMKDHPESHPKIAYFMAPGRRRYHSWHPVKNSNSWARWFFIHDDQTEDGVPVYFIRLHPASENFGGLTDKEQVQMRATQLTGLTPDGQFIGED